MLSERKKMLLSEGIQGLLALQRELGTRSIRMQSCLERGIIPQEEIQQGAEERVSSLEDAQKLGTLERRLSQLEKLRRTSSGSHLDFTASIKESKQCHGVESALSGCVNRYFTKESDPDVTLNLLKEFLLVKYKQIPRVKKDLKEVIKQLGTIVSHETLPSTNRQVHDSVPSDRILNELEKREMVKDETDSGLPLTSESSVKSVPPNSGTKLSGYSQSTQENLLDVRAITLQQLPGSFSPIAQLLRSESGLSSMETVSGVREQERVSKMDSSKYNTSSSMEVGTTEVVYLSSVRSVHSDEEYSWDLENSPNLQCNYPEIYLQDQTTYSQSKPASCPADEMFPSVGDATRQNLCNTIRAIKKQNMVSTEMKEVALSKSTSSSRIDELLSDIIQQQIEFQITRLETVQQKLETRIVRLIDLQRQSTTSETEGATRLKEKLREVVVRNKEKKPKIEITNSPLLSSHSNISDIKLPPDEKIEKVETYNTEMLGKATSVEEGKLISLTISSGKSSAPQFGKKDCKLMSKKREDVPEKLEKDETIVISLQFNSHDTDTCTERTSASYAPKKKLRREQKLKECEQFPRSQVRYPLKEKGNRKPLAAAVSSQDVVCLEESATDPVVERSPSTRQCIFSRVCAALENVGPKVPPSVGEQEMSGPQRGWEEVGSQTEEERCGWATSPSIAIQSNKKSVSSQVEDEEAAPPGANRQKRRRSRKSQHAGVMVAQETQTPKELTSRRDQSTGTPPPRARHSPPVGMYSHERIGTQCELDDSRMTHKGVVVPEFEEVRKSSSPLMVDERQSKEKSEEEMGRGDSRKSRRPRSRLTSAERLRTTTQSQKDGISAENSQSSQHPERYAASEEFGSSACDTRSFSCKKSTVSDLSRFDGDKNACVQTQSFGYRTLSSQSLEVTRMVSAATETPHRGTCNKVERSVSCDIAGDESRGLFNGAEGMVSFGSPLEATDFSDDLSGKVLTLNRSDVACGPSVPETNTQATRHEFGVPQFSSYLEHEPHESVIYVHHRTSESSFTNPTCTPCEQAQEIRMARSRTMDLPLLLSDSRVPFSENSRIPRDRIPQNDSMHGPIPNTLYNNREFPGVQLNGTANGSTASIDPQMKSRNAGSMEMVVNNSSRSRNNRGSQTRLTSITCGLYCPKSCRRKATESRTTAPRVSDRKPPFVFLPPSLPPAAPAFRTSSRRCVPENRNPPTCVYDFLPQQFAVQRPSDHESHPMPVGYKSIDRRCKGICNSRTWDGCFAQGQHRSTRGRRLSVPW